MNRFSAVILLLILTTVLPFPARAEVKVIEAESSYLIGENDSRADSRRIAAQEARWKVLDLAGAYVENLAAVKNSGLNDKVKTYVAGILETEVVSEQMRGTTEHPELCIRARCRIDTAVLMARIDRYQENEDLQEQLAAFSRENDECRREREGLVIQLAGQKDRSKAEETRKKLDSVLSKEESNNDTIAVCARIGHKLDDEEGNSHDIKQADLDSSAVILERAVKVNPQNQRAHCLLALIFRQQSDQNAAENELRTAILNNTSSPAPHMKLGILLRELGRYREAEKEFHFVERVRPHNLPVVFYSGMTFKDMDKCGKAVQDLNRFLKDNRVDKYPRKKETAVAAIEECGGDRPGRQKRIKTAVR